MVAGWQAPNAAAQQGALSGFNDVWHARSRMPHLLPHTTSGPLGPRNASSSTQQLQHPHQLQQQQHLNASMSQLGGLSGSYSGSSVMAPASHGGIGQHQHQYQQQHPSLSGPPPAAAPDRDPFGGMSLAQVRSDGMGWAVPRGARMRGVWDCVLEGCGWEGGHRERTLAPWPPSLCAALPVPPTTITTVTTTTLLQAQAGCPPPPRTPLSPPRAHILARPTHNAAQQCDAFSPPHLPCPPPARSLPPSPRSKWSAPTSGSSRRSGWRRLQACAWRRRSAAAGWLAASGGSPVRLGGGACWRPQ